MQWASLSSRVDKWWPFLNLISSAGLSVHSPTAFPLASWLSRVAGVSADKSSCSGPVTGSCRCPKVPLVLVAPSGLGPIIPEPAKLGHSISTFFSE